MTLTMPSPGATLTWRLWTPVLPCSIRIPPAATMSSSPRARTAMAPLPSSSVPTKLSCPSITCPSKTPTAATSTAVWPRASCRWRSIPPLAPPCPWWPPVWPTPWR